MCPRRWVIARWIEHIGRERRARPDKMGCRVAVIAENR